MRGGLWNNSRSEADGSCVGPAADCSSGELQTEADVWVSGRIGAAAAARQARPAKHSRARNGGKASEQAQRSTASTAAAAAAASAALSLSFLWARKGARPGP